MTEETNLCRLAQLAVEEQSWRAALDREGDVGPDLVPVIIVRVDGGVTGA